MLNYVAFEGTALFIGRQVCEVLGYTGSKANLAKTLSRHCPNAKQAKEYGVKPTGARQNSALLTLDEVLHLATHCQYDASGVLTWLRNEGLWNGSDVSSATRREMDVLAGVELALGRPLQRQYQVGPFRIDGYDPISNIAFEVDESQHLAPANQLSDELRELFITESIPGITFRRLSI